MVIHLHVYFTLFRHMPSVISALITVTIGNVKTSYEKCIDSMHCKYLITKKSVHLNIPIAY